MAQCSGAGEKQIEVAGGLLDSGSVKELSAAIEAPTIECIAMRHDADRSRKLGHELVEALSDVSARAAGDQGPVAAEAVITSPPPAI